MSSRIEIVSRVSGRRRWTVEQKLAVLRDAFGLEGCVRAACERHDVGSGSIYTWRRLTLSGNYAYNGGYFGEAENRQRQHSYHLFNATVEYKTSGGVSVAAWAKNIGNIAYASQLYTTGAGDKVRIAPGRTYGVTLGFDF